MRAAGRLPERKCGWWWPPPTRQAAGHSTWYLLPDLPRPTGRRCQAAELAEVVRLYGCATSELPEVLSVTGDEQGLGERQPQVAVNDKLIAPRHSAEHGNRHPPWPGSWRTGPVQRVGSWRRPDDRVIPVR